MANIFKPSASSSSASGGTGKNYLGTVNSVNGNGDFELGAVTGWSLGTVTLTSGTPTGVPTFGSGASGNLAFTVTTSGKLAGSYSGQYASSAATTAGDFLASDAFTIDIEDQAKAITVKFYYSPTVGSNTANWSGTSSNSFGIAIYDVSASAWIIPAGQWSMVQGSGVGIATATFQTSATSTQYRLVIYNASATTGACTLLVDDFFLGPNTAPIGPVITDAVAYTPTFTGFGTASAVNFTSYRSGQYLIINGTFTAGTTTGTEAQITLGFNGTSGNVTSVSTLPTLSVVGDLKGGTASATYFARGAVLIEASKTYLTLSVDNSSTTLAKSNGNAFTSSVTYSLYAAVPITGWSSNVSMSNDTDTRVVAMRYNGATAVISSAYASLIWTTLVSDTHGSMGSTQYTVPVSGFYDFAAQAIVTGTLALNGTVNIQVTKNGSTVQESGLVAGGSVTGNVPVQIALDAVSCNAGDTISIQAKSSGTLPSVVSSTADNFFTVARRSGPVVIAATESVNARYTDTSGVQITPVFTTFKFLTKTFDTHNFYETATGIGKIPISGKFRVSSGIGLSTITLTTQNLFQLQLTKNGSVSTVTTVVGSGGAGNVYTASFSDTISGIAGDTFAVQVRTGITASAATTTGNNWLAIERIGN